MKKFTFVPQTTPITLPVGPESWRGKYGSQFTPTRYFIELEIDGRKIHFSVRSYLVTTEVQNVLQNELYKYPRIQSSVTVVDEVPYDLFNHRSWHELYSLDEAVGYIRHMFPTRWTVNVPPIIGSEGYTKTFLSQEEANKYAERIRHEIITINKR